MFVWYSNLFFQRKIHAWVVCWETNIGLNVWFTWNNLQVDNNGIIKWSPEEHKIMTVNVSKYFSSWQDLFTLETARENLGIEMTIKETITEHFISIIMLCLKVQHLKCLGWFWFLNFCLGQTEWSLPRKLCNNWPNTNNSLLWTLHQVLLFAEDNMKTKLCNKWGNIMIYIYKVIK